MEYRVFWYDGGMKRALIRHDGLFLNHAQRFYSIILERLDRRRVRLTSLSGRKYYRSNGKVREKVWYEGTDARRAHRIRERLVNARLKTGYEIERGILAHVVRKRLLALGARADEIYTELVGITVGPERRATAPLELAGRLVIPTLRGRTLRRHDRRRGYSVANGRSWLVAQEGTMRLISQSPGFDYWETNLTREQWEKLRPLAPFVIEGSHGGIEPATREYPYDFPEFLPEDLVRIRGERVGDLPYAERRAMLEELLKATDPLGHLTTIVPPATRELLAQEAEFTARTGRLIAGSRALPLVRRLGSPIDDEDGRIVLLARVATTEMTSA